MKIGCTKCGANIVYLAGRNRCYCSHCNSEIPIEEYEKQNYEIEYEECTCSSCGAKLLVEESTLITVCAYCGSRELVKNKYKGELKIDGIIPYERRIEQLKEDIQKRKEEVQ